VDFDRRSNDLAAEAIRFLIQWMHRRELLPKTARKVHSKKISPKTITFANALRTTRSTFAPIQGWIGFSEDDDVCQRVRDNAFHLGVFSKI